MRPAPRIALLLVLLSTAARAAAQRPATVAILGTVVDAESGNLVINATASVTNLHRQAEVDSRGSFALRGLAPGSHFVLVSAPGYEPVAELVDASADADMGRIELSPAVFRLAPINVVASVI